MIDKGDYIQLENEEEVRKLEEEIEKEGKWCIIEHADGYGGGCTVYHIKDGKKYVVGYYKIEDMPRPLREEFEKREEAINRFNKNFLFRLIEKIAGIIFCIIILTGSFIDNIIDIIRTFITHIKKHKS